VILQVKIGTQTVTLNALQVASVASKSNMSGTIISGNKPIAAISGCTCGFTVEGVDGCDYEAVRILTYRIYLKSTTVQLYNSLKYHANLE
jgi:hypothetical protein